MPSTQPRRSPEVEAVTRRAFDAFARGDRATMSRLMEPGPEFRSIGSDPDEWWGPEFTPILLAQMEEMSGIEYDILDLEAWELGDVAWVSARVDQRLAGTEVVMRVTGVLVLDEGAWRIVQWHNSEGVPNEESLGFTLTTTLSEILDSLDIERDLGDVGSEGMLTLMFTDVEGSTTHVRELGDRTYTQLMAEHLTLVTELADRFGGRVIKSIGDGALLTFPSARSAVGCAIEIQRGTDRAGVPFAIRIGIHAGDVVRTDSDVMGFAVNKAARVTSAADGGQIVVSSVVQELVGADPAFVFRDPIFAELKGIDGLHALAKVDWQHSPAKQ